VDRRAVESILDGIVESNTSIEVFTAGIHVIPDEECLALFMDYLRLTRNLKDLAIRYEEPEDDDDLDVDDDDQPHDYLSKMDHILDAVRKNPGIQKLTLYCLGNPQFIQDLLAGNES
jgi:hypothetical protein